MDVPADGVARAFLLPKLKGLTATYFLHLRLEDAAGQTVSRNFYWLSTKPDRLDWAATTWSRTPLESAADFTALSALAPAEVAGAADFETRGPEGVARVRVTNTGKTLAFLVRLKLARQDNGEEILPVLWEDNYFELFPGETREIRATYHLRDSGGAHPALEISGWNLNRHR